MGVIKRSNIDKSVNEWLGRGGSANVTLHYDHTFTDIFTKIQLLSTQTFIGQIFAVHDTVAEKVFRNRCSSVKTTKTNTI